MNEIVSRYEFRAFAQTFGLAAEKIRRLAPCDAITESAELYLLSRQDRRHNVKVRGGQLDIKQLIEITMPSWAWWKKLV